MNYSPADIEALKANVDFLAGFGWVVKPLHKEFHASLAQLKPEHFTPKLAQVVKDATGRGTLHPALIAIHEIRETAKKVA